MGCIWTEEPGDAYPPPGASSRVLVPDIVRSPAWSPPDGRVRMRAIASPLAECAALRRTSSISTTMPSAGATAAQPDRCLAGATNSRRMRRGPSATGVRAVVARRAMRATLTRRFGARRGWDTWKDDLHEDTTARGAQPIAPVRPSSRGSGPGQEPLGVPPCLVPTLTSRFRAVSPVATSVVPKSTTTPTVSATCPTRTTAMPGLGAATVTGPGCGTATVCARASCATADG